MMLFRLQLIAMRARTARPVVRITILMEPSNSFEAAVARSVLRADTAIDSADSHGTAHGTAGVRCPKLTVRADADALRIRRR